MDRPVGLGFGRGFPSRIFSRIFCVPCCLSFTVFAAPLKSAKKICETYVSLKTKICEQIRSPKSRIFDSRIFVPQMFLADVCLTDSPHGCLSVIFVSRMYYSRICLSRIVHSLIFVCVFYSRLFFFFHGFLIH